jgi:hypothetical protein
MSVTGGIGTGKVSYSTAGIDQMASRALRRIGGAATVLLQES